MKDPLGFLVAVLLEAAESMLGQNHTCFGPGRTLSSYQNNIHGILVVHFLRAFGLCLLTQVSVLIVSRPCLRSIVLGGGLLHDEMA